MTDELTPSASGLTTASVKRSRTAAEAVSEYAQASITLVPRLIGMPSWYAPIQAAVDTAQGQSETWLNTICPAMSTGVPQAIVTFNSEFQSGSRKVLSTIEAIGSGKPTAQQKSAISRALNGLLAGAEKQAATAAGVKKELTGYTTGLVQDVNALGTAIGTLEEHLADGNQYVQKLKEVIGQHFIDVESKVTPCLVIVTIDMDIEVKVTTVGAPQEAIAIVYAQTLIETLDDNVKSSMEPLQVVLDSWGTLQAKIAAVISDLNSAEGEYVSLLKGFDLQAAQTQWSQLSQYASGLLPGAEQ